VPNPAPKPNPNDNIGRPPGGATSPAEEKGAYKFLPIECPNCGFQGKVKISRLDQTFHCKQCNQVFHITRDGTMAGERPVDTAPIDHAAAPIEEKPSWLERTYVMLPPWAKWVALGVLVLLMAYGVTKLLEPAEPLPRDLEARAALAAKSFAVGDWSTLKRMAMAGSGRHLSQWYDANRPEEWRDVEAAAIQAKVTSVRKTLKRYEKQIPILNAETKIEFQVPGQPVYTASFFWDETVTEDWWLDGERMAKESRVKKGTGKPQATDDEAPADEQENPTEPPAAG
jgi:hypothetical protein